MAFPGTLPEKELAWLKLHGGSGSTIMDCWATFLDARGQPPGATMDRRRNWLASFAPATVPRTTLDLLLWFWSPPNSGAFP